MPPFQHSAGGLDVDSTRGIATLRYQSQNLLRDSSFVPSSQLAPPASAQEVQKALSHCDTPSVFSLLAVSSITWSWITAHSIQIELRLVLNP